MSQDYYDNDEQEPSRASGRHGRRRAGLSWPMLVLALLSGIAIPIAGYGWLAAYTTLVERGRPNVRAYKPPSGLGLAPVSFYFEFDDAKSGLSEVVMRLEQGGRVREIYRKVYPQPVMRDAIEVTLEATKLDLRPGLATVEMVAFDRTIWANTMSVTVQVPVVLEPPKIEVLVPPVEPLEENGSGTVIFRASGRDVLASLVWRQNSILAFPALLFDEAFQQRPDIFVALFPVNGVPDDHFPSLYEIQVKDPVGNHSEWSKALRVTNPGSLVRKLYLVPGAVSALMSREFTRYLKLKQKLAREITHSEREYERSEQAILDHIGSWGADYNDLSEELLRHLVRRPMLKRVWRKPFLPFDSDRIRFDYGDDVTWWLVDKPLWSFRSNGISIPGAAGDDVQARNGGRVIFADDLGAYGKLVLLDHGFGLVSSYAHLQEASVREGDMVDRGTVIGTLGSSGMSDRPAVGIDFRLHGVAIRPQQWSNRAWAKRNLIDSIDAAKQAVGLPVKHSIDEAS